jgi:cyclic pyranopterin phosphate synthase
MAGRRVLAFDEVAAMKRLIDPAGRHIRKLRVSLTEACNFRCFYCMPQHPVFAPASELLPPDRLIELCRLLVDEGLEEIRITGGEPTLRPELLEIVSGLAALPLKRLGMTSNALRLGPMLGELKARGLQNLNISLDSLNAATFERVTGSKAFDAVMRSILEARDTGFEVKLNAVVFRGLNSHELGDFAAFADREHIPVRFLELMKIGPRHDENQQHYMSAAEMIDQLRQSELELTPLPSPVDATAFEFQLKGGGRIGFIASESQPFCGGCSRLRLSAKGMLRACLMKEDGIDIRHVSPHELPGIVQQVMGMKPLTRIDHVDQPMVQIGG